MTGNNTTANTTHADNESTLGDSSSPRTNIDARMKLLYLIVCNVLVMGLNTRSTLWPIIIAWGYSLPATCPGDSSWDIWPLSSSASGQRYSPGYRE